MSAYLKTLGLHVYLATTKKTYFGNDKYIEANAQALKALRRTLNKDYLFMISHCDSAFTVWNTLTSPKLKTTNHVEKEPLWMSPSKLAIWSKGMTPLRYTQKLI